MKTFSSHVAAAVFLLILLTGCVKNQFSIRFEFPKDYVGNYMVDYYAWDSRKGTWIERVAPVQNGAVSLECVTSRPTVVYVRDASSSASVAVYVEKGDEIVISGDKPDMNTWKVKGNEVSERWSRWRNSNAALLTAARDSMTAQKKKAVAEFVKANKDDVLATLILLTDYDRGSDPDGFVALWNSISEDARGGQTVEMCGCTDLLGVSFSVDADGSLKRAKAKKPGPLVVRTRDNGIDTLDFARVSAAFLYFYDDNNSMRAEVADSLRAVARQYPDSTGRILSMVALHPDSMVWVNSTRRDTIGGLVRSWVPRGVADRDMVGMGVVRVPWFVITGRGGTEAYSGSELKKALDVFRKEMDRKKKKDSKPGK